MGQFDRAYAIALTNDQVKIEKPRPKKRGALLPGNPTEGKRSEHDEQAALFAWASHNLDRYPELDEMFAIPNGGHRHMAVAAKLKAEGVKAGVVDICLPVPVGQYHGMWIEMKVGRNKPTPEQTRRIEQLRRRGYHVVVCYSKQAAVDALIQYLTVTKL